MADLKTKYMGLELKNPIIVGACNITADVEKVKQLEEAGAAAIIYKSLFEEQIQLESLEMESGREDYAERHAEMTTIFPNIQHAGAKEHIYNLKKVKNAVNIPVIASLNAVYDFSWEDYAKQLADAGVDGLELNFYTIPGDFNKSADEIEKAQIQIVAEVKKAVKIPVSVKLSPFYTNLLGVVKRMDDAGADAFVLFNRLFQPEIDVDTEKHHFPWNLSNKGAYRLALRYIGLLAGNIKADIAANNGILTGREAIQTLLAGAQTVQIVSTLYKNKIEYIKEMLADITAWMDAKEYKVPCDFRGKLSKAELNDPYAYKRAQYVDILWNSNDIFKLYPMR